MYLQQRFCSAFLFDNKSKLAQLFRSLSAVFYNRDSAPHGCFLESALGRVKYSRPSLSFGHVPCLWVISPRLEQFRATRVLVVYLTTSLLLLSLSASVSSLAVPGTLLIAVVTSPDIGSDKLFNF
jgi:hypothetical protein